MLFTVSNPRDVVVGNIFEAPAWQTAGPSWAIFALRLQERDYCGQVMYLVRISRDQSAALLCQPSCRSWEAHILMVQRLRIARLLSTSAASIEGNDSDEIDHD